MSKKRHKEKRDKTVDASPEQVEELKGIVEEASRLAVLCTCSMPDLTYPCGMHNWQAFLTYHSMKGGLEEAGYVGAQGFVGCFFLNPDHNGGKTSPVFGVANQTRFKTAGRVRTTPTVVVSMFQVGDGKEATYHKIERTGHKDTKDKMTPMVAQLIAMAVEEGLKTKNPLLVQTMENLVNVERVEKLCGGYHALKASMRFTRP